MPFITVGQENSADIELYYTDQGSGQPVVLIHGYPLNGASWEQQTAALLEAGLPGDHVRPARLRRLQPAERRLRLRHLRRRPERAVGRARPDRRGAGRFLDGRRRGGPLSRPLRVRPGQPRRLPRRDHPLPAEDRRQPHRGRAEEFFEGFSDDVKKDRFAFYTGSSPTSTTWTRTWGSRISEEAVRNSWNVAAGGGARRRGRRPADLADRLPRRHRHHHGADPDRARHRGQHRADRRQRHAAASSCCPTRPTSSWRVRRTAFWPPTATRSTRNCSDSWPR